MKAGHIASDIKQFAAKDRLQVLIVDDEIEALNEIEEQIESPELVCHRASDGVEALRMVTRYGLPDVVITDIHMPSFDGIDFVEQLHRWAPENQRCAVIFISGRAEIDTVIAAMRLEGVDFLKKPLNPAELHAAVGSACRKARAKRQPDERFDSITAGIAQIKRQTTSLSRNFDAIDRLLSSMPSPAEVEQPSSEPAGDYSEMALLRLLTQIKAARTRLQDNNLTDDGWDILVDLMMAELANRDVSIMSLCMASDTPQTTAYRKVVALEQQKLIKRRADPIDRRRVLAELTDEGKQKVLAYLRLVRNALLHKPKRSMES